MQTGGVEVLAISTKSRPANSALCKASLVETTPNCSPFSSINLTSLAVISSFSLVWSFGGVFPFGAKFFMGLSFHLCLISTQFYSFLLIKSRDLSQILLIY